MSMRLIAVFPLAGGRQWRPDHVPEELLEEAGASVERLGRSQRRKLTGRGAPDRYPKPHQGERERARRLKQMARNGS